MHMPRILVASVALATVLPLSPSVSAADADRGAQQRRPGAGVLYLFDSRESLVGGSRVLDSMGRRNDGSVVAANGGQVTSVRHHRGWAARFPGRCVQQGCPRAFVSTPNRRGLNPGRRAFSFGAQVRVSADSTAAKSTVIQKGRYTNPRGRWRLRLDWADARPYCLVRGTAGTVLMRSRTGIADGRWHSVACVRTADMVRLVVDGEVVRAKEGRTGRVANRAPVSIGGFATVARSNQFFGTLDRVYLRTRR